MMLHKANSSHPHASQTDTRPAMVLLIVIVLLTLFAVTGLAFVYYGDSAATNASIIKDDQARRAPEVDSEASMAYFLGKLIYGDDDNTGIYSALRGHDLMRSAYGMDYDLVNNAAGVPVVTMRNRSSPFSGTGRLHYSNAGVLNGIDDYDLINYTYYQADGFLRDPERFGARANNNPATQLGTPTGGNNVPYTYPDLHSYYLAAVKFDPNGNPTLLTPSFHREYLFGQLDKYPGTNPPNANWTNAQGKYLTLRPRPNENPGFPYPEDRFGDVRNLPGYGGMDSIWIDLDAPIMTAPDGRRYKMLFAPLIIDLDGRINLNYAGSLAGRSNQGWGRWEMNLGKVFTQNAAEWPNLFRGNGTLQAGRYVFRATGPYGTISTGPSGPWYAPVNYDASAGAAPLTQPTAGQFTTFRNNPGGYGNSNAAELANHPAGYNFYNANNQPSPPGTTPPALDRRFEASNMEAMLRIGDKGSPGLTSELLRLLPLNFGVSQSPANLPALRTRNLVTTHSFDLDVPGVTPYVWNPQVAPYLYNPAATFGYPMATTQMPFPDPPTQRTTTPAGSEFDANTWRALSAAIGRVNLNRTLGDYPAPDFASGTGLIPNGALNPLFKKAQEDRQTFARDLYNALIQATGARDPNVTTDLNNQPLGAVTAPQVDTARWLAQLAVNIVDYIDKDDYMTPFLWWAQNVTPVVPAAPAAANWVYGTELPRLVLNEVYAQFDNAPTDTAGVMPTGFKVNVWAELHNTFNNTPVQRWDTATDDGTAYLQYPGGQKPYQVVLQRSFAENIAYLATANTTNTTGAPNPVGLINGEANTPQIVTDFGTTAATQKVLPSNGAYSGPSGGNTGFYVLGPTAGLVPAVRDPNLPKTFGSLQMTLPVPATATVANTTVRPLVLLQRLACPNLAFDPITNPYITVDYRESEPLNDNHTVNADGTANGTLAGIPTFFSNGREQPYAGAAGRWKPQNPTTPQPGQPRHTFYRHNGQEDAPPLNTTAAQTLQQPFDWLVHLDRPLVSPMELLHVSGHRPHRLTHRFVTGVAAAPVKFQHYARWLDQATRLHRFLEFVKTNDRGAGMDDLVRLPGKVNINTIWENEVWDAVFDDPRSTALFSNMITRRSPNYTTTVNPTDHHRSATGPPVVILDRPFRSLAQGWNDPPSSQYLNPTGIGSTFLQPAALGGLPTDPRLFDVTAAHPYDQRALLTKAFNHLTVRSNVFAVWVTVGFFEVTDESTKPAKLGAEMNRSENRHVRHRFFAIVDRTAVNNFFYTATGQQTAFTLTTVPPLATGIIVPPGSPGVSQKFTVPATLFTVTGTRFQCGVGTRLVIDERTASEETLIVTAVDNPANPTELTATFTKSHGNNAPITWRGHPGPWVNYNPRRDTGVVPYFSVID